MNYTCIKRVRTSSNKIIKYKLQDNTGKIIEVYPKELKQAIRENKITVVNLTLTSDNKLLYKGHMSSRQDELRKLLLKSKMLGLPIIECNTACKHKIYIVSKSQYKHLVIIPDDVKVIAITADIRYGVQLDESNTCTEFARALTQLHGTIKVIGGAGLISTSQMFNYIIEGGRLDVLDLSDLNTSNVKDMSGMFSNINVHKLILGDMNTSKVETMQDMFGVATIDEVDLSKLQTDNVKNLSLMFRAFDTREDLVLSNFNTSSVIDFEGMFYSTTSPIIDITNFNFSNAENINNMFYENNAQYIYLNDFNVNKIKNNILVFNECKAKILKTPKTDIIVKYKCLCKIRDKNDVVLGYKVLTKLGKEKIIDIDNIDEEHTEIINKDTEYIEKYERNYALAKLTRQERIDYCSKYGETGDLYLYVCDIDMLGCALDYFWRIQANSSGGYEQVALRMRTHPNSLYMLNNMRNICIARGLLTEQQFNLYFTGTNYKGYLCDQYTFTEWILDYKK